MKFEGLRKLIFAVLVFLVLCVFRLIDKLPAGNFENILIWIGSAYFLANTGEHVTKYIKGKDKENSG